MKSFLHPFIVSIVTFIGGVNEVMWISKPLKIYYLDPFPTLNSMIFLGSFCWKGHRPFGESLQMLRLQPHFSSSH